jgi:DNA polymerase-3 subunit gamma/tau
VTPCGECESCVTIAAGTSMDVIEMDAASNRSVDDVRDLRERVAYAPSGGHWKVYILDEAHMLTKEAWNAFLKTLEEPPPSTVFVLATTEAHKVMPTIADRCQRFDFQRPSLKQISEVLLRVADAEAIEVDDGAVAMIARSATGSFRDALGTLDQLAAFGTNRVGLNDVLDLLGAADAELLFEAVDAVGEQDAAGVLAAVEKLARSGRDPTQFARDLLAHLRHLLVIQTTGEVPETFVVTSSDPDRLRAQAAAVGGVALVRAIDELSEAITAIREGDDARMSVELALLKAARPDLDPSTEALLGRLERLERQLGAGEAVPKPSKKAPNPAPEPDPPSDEPLATSDEPSEERATSDEQLDLERIVRSWPAILDQVRQQGSGMLAALLEGARPVGLDGENSVLRIGFPTSATFNKRKVEAAEQRDRISEALRTIVGERLRPVYVLLEGDQQGQQPAEEEQLDEDALLEKIKAEFDAEEVAEG